MKEKEKLRDYHARVKLRDYQARVRQEKQELDLKIAKLGLFNESNNTASEAEKFLLSRQYAVMKEYSDILGKRIDSF